MAATEFRRSVFRIISDLIKLDKTVSTSELEYIDRISDQYGITDEDRRLSHSMTLATALDNISRQGKRTKEKIIRYMTDCAMQDGYCSRDEAILISAVEIICEGKGQITSLPINNRPLITTQILYIDPTYNPKRNELDKNFGELNAIAEIAGFDLIYIPKIAESFKKNHAIENLNRLISLINPLLDEVSLKSSISSLQDMDSRYFYLQVLNGRLQMNLNIEQPCWMIRLHDSNVNGIEHANYLFYHVQSGLIAQQLKEYVNRLNTKLAPYQITVNRRSYLNDFAYEGFYKALLDVIASDRKDEWGINVYIRAGRTFIADRSKTGEKFSIEITKGSQSYPIRINGREAAFYLLLLCASADPEKGINFEYEKARSARIQAGYEAAYGILSNREGHIPDITLLSTLRPIKTKVMNALKNSGPIGNLHLFKPTKRGTGTLYIPLPSENVKIVSSKGSTSLIKSTIFDNIRRLL